MLDNKLISNVQALRALAALLVVFYHTGYKIAGVSTSYMGVELFFCISGFVMTYISRSEEASDFLRARLVRIVPLYWVATFAFFLWTRLGMSNPPYVWPILWDRLLHRPHMLWHWAWNNVVLDGPTLSALLKSFLFVPYQSSSGTMLPILGVGWTLNLEMFFYVLFTLALAVHRKLAPVLVVGALLVIRATLQDASAPIAFFAHENLIFFITGIGCYYAWAWLPAPAIPGKWVALSVAVLALAAYLWLGWWTHLASSGRSELARLAYMGAPPMGLFVALWCHSAGVRVRGRAVLELGAASYALYLFHLFILEATRATGETWPWWDTSRSVPGMLVSTLLCVGLALLLHWYVEKPLTRRLRKRFMPSAPAPVAPLPAASGVGA